MKGISLQPPWGWLIVHGLKDVENRTWRSKFTGRIVIHQSKRWDREGMAAIYKIELPTWVKIMDHMLAAHAYGLIGEVDFSPQVSQSDSKWFFGPYAWPCSNPLAYEHPYIIPGRLGFFDVPDSLVMRLRLI